MDWAAVIALAAAVAVFGLLQGGNFFSPANAVNILRSMSITTIFAIAATLTMAPDGFDMSACTLATVSSFLFASLFLWFGLPLWLSVAFTVVLTSDGKQQIVYKHAISTIVPERPIPLYEPGEVS